jgi:arabinogalactan oligomer/maltooligosaccharide transport system permease protein
MRKNKNVGTYIVLVIISIIWLLPFVGIILQSFRSYVTEFGGMVDYLLPKQFSLDSYKWLFSSESQFFRWYANTFIIALFTAIGQTCMVLMVSYSLSRMRFKGRQLWMNICLILGMFPGFLTMICLYFLLKQVGLTQQGAIPGLILINVASSGMGYYVCKGFFDTIPKSLDEAARIDGASRARIFFTMIIPLAKPMVIYTALTAFMAPWCDYIFASYVAFGYSKSYNVAVALYNWVNTNDYQGYFTRFCAGGVLVAVPVTILFMCLQKYYVEGVTGGAVKG